MNYTWAVKITKTVAYMRSVNYKSTEYQNKECQAINFTKDHTGQPNKIKDL